jgi:hypothetical protein
MIVNYASSVINKLEALLTDDARVVIYDRHVFIVQATGQVLQLYFYAIDKTEKLVECRSTKMSCLSIKKP